MKKDIGNEKNRARARAVSVLAGLKGKDVNKFNQNEIKEVLVALLQLFGLVDQDGIIK